MGQKYQKRIKNLVLMAILSMICAGACLANETKQTVFYVSVKGCDAWSGRLAEVNMDRTDGPFATLARAKEAVRETLSGTDEGPVTVILRGGRYSLNETVVFGPQDSGTKSRPVVYRAYPGEKPVLCGTKPILNFEKMKFPVKGMSREAAAHCYVADVPLLRGEKWHFNVLYENGQLQPRARDNGFIPELVDDEDVTSPFVGNKAKGVFIYPEGLFDENTDLEDAEIFGVPSWGFCVNYLGIARIEPDRRLAYTDVPATYKIGPKLGLIGIDGEHTAMWVENVPSALDEPGEWCLDTSAGKVYFWPQSGTPGRVEAPTVVELVRLKGMKKSPVEYIRFEGLTFANTDRVGFHLDDICIQHDWEWYDKSTALVRFENSQYCELKECSFEDSGSAGVRFDFHSQFNGIDSCRFNMLGGVGVLFCGYGPGTVDVNHHNRIVNSHFSYCGQLWWHAPAIMIWQSGHNTIAHNLVHNTPYTGIVVSGVRPPFFGVKEPIREIAQTILLDRDQRPETYSESLPYLHARCNRVEYNEVYAAMEKLSDGNGIYISGAGEGNVIRGNYVHHILGYGCQSGIRIDDFQEDAVVTENVVYKCVSGGITLKHNNTVTNNIIAEMIGERTYDGREFQPYGFILLRRGPSDYSVIENNIYYQSGDIVSVYCEGRNTWHPEFVKNISATDKNLYWLGFFEKNGRKFLNEYQAHGVEENSRVANPMFVDMENGDFRLAADSPALKLGIRPIDVSLAGPKKNER